MPEKTRYLLIIGLGDNSKERVPGLAQELKAALTRISDLAPEPVFRCAVSDYFGFLIRTELRADQIVSALKEPTTKDRSKTTTPKILAGNDALLILEVGDRVIAADGFARVLMWTRKA